MGSNCQTRVVLILAVIGLVPAPAIAGPLDPNAFASLGVFPSVAGGYSINTSALMAPTLTGPGGTTLSGVYYQDSPGHTVAVFDFASINLTGAETITATGAVPLVLLSQGDVTIGGTINGNGSLSSLTPVAGPGGGSTAGNPGPGAGSQFFGNGSGGGFGGAGGSGGVFTSNNGGIIPSGPGGAAYGNLFVSLQGGSAGGGVSAAGGAIEIGAAGNLHVLASGVVEADGASSGVVQFGSGGGSGGGLFFHGNVVSVDDGAVISAHGGNGGGSVSVPGPGGGSGGGGGGGGGGRVLFADNNGFFRYPNSPINVLPGLGGSPSTGTANGMTGTITYVSLKPVPEPSSLAMVATAIAVGLGCKFGRRRTSGGR